MGGEARRNFVDLSNPGVVVISPSSYGPDFENQIEAFAQKLSSQRPESPLPSYEVADAGFFGGVYVYSPVIGGAKLDGLGCYILMNTSGTWIRLVNRRLFHTF